MMEKLNFGQNNETFFNQNYNGGINQIKGKLDEDDNSLDLNHQTLNQISQNPNIKSHNRVQFGLLIKFKIKNS